MMQSDDFGFGTQIRKSPYFDATVRWGAKGFSVYNHMYIPRDFGDLIDRDRAELAWAFQGAAVQAVILKLSRAHQQLREQGINLRTLFVGGGVSSNSLLRVELKLWADEHDLRLVIPPMRYCVDNAAMIAGLGGEMFGAGVADDLSLRAHPQSAY